MGVLAAWLWSSSLPSEVLGTEHQDHELGRLPRPLAGSVMPSGLETIAWALLRGRRLGACLWFLL